MRTGKILLIFVGTIVCLLAILFFSSAIADQPKKIDFAAPLQQSETEKAIDAKLAQIDANIQLAIQKLDAVTIQLNDITAKIQRIEDALGIKPPIPPTAPGEPPMPSRKITE